MPHTLGTAEHQRLLEDKQRTANWKRWGPYLSQRQWATVREDYSGNGEPGVPSRTTTPDRARTAGAKTDCWGSAIANAGSVRVGIVNHRDPILKERTLRSQWSRRQSW